MGCTLNNWNGGGGGQNIGCPLPCWHGQFGVVHPGGPLIIGVLLTACPLGCIKPPANPTGDGGRGAASCSSQSRRMPCSTMRGCSGCMENGFAIAGWDKGRLKSGTAFMKDELKSLPEGGSMLSGCEARLAGGNMSLPGWEARLEGGSITSEWESRFEGGSMLLLDLEDP